MAEVQLTEIQKEQLIKITAFNLKARYPDFKRSFKEKCTEDFTRNELNRIEEIFGWLKSLLQ